MNSVASGGLHNILADTTWSSGFLNASGVVVSAGATTKEQVTDFIDVGTATALIFYSEVNSTSQKWIGISQYDSNKTHLGRRVVNDTMVGFVFEPSTQYIRISFRTYGDSQALANLIDVDTTDTIYVGD